MMEEMDLRPRATPLLLRDAATMCARRLACESGREPATKDPVNRARVREALLDLIRLWHETDRVSDPTDLVDEERAVVDHAFTWYRRLFPDQVSEASLPVAEPTWLPRRGVLLGGWVDLGIVHPDGRRELRQLTWDGRPLPPDPLELPPVKLAVLRLAQLGWIDAGSLDITVADLLTGATTEATVTPPDGLTPLAGWLDERWAVLQARADVGAAEPGAGCGMCRFVPRCPAHDVHASMFTRRDALVPALLAITPTSVEAWRRCRRAWRSRFLLRLPESNPSGGGDHGVFVHRILRLVHRDGSCQDTTYVADVLARHVVDRRTADEVARHATRCPIGAAPVGHEVDWARAHPGPPVFVATARVDAAWEHDGMLDVRDYKTGGVAPYPIHEDPRARLQAWVAAPVARQRGQRLRLRYEHLAAEVREDPDPWEPSDEDLAAVERELAACVTEMFAERDFAGVADETICASCTYRGACSDSAVAATPSWPAPTPLPMSAEGRPSS